MPRKKLYQCLAFRACRSAFSPSPASFASWLACVCQVTLSARPCAQVGVLSHAFGRANYRVASRALRARSKLSPVKVGNAMRPLRARTELFAPAWRARHAGHDHLASFVAFVRGVTPAARRVERDLQQASNHSKRQMGRPARLGKSIPACRGITTRSS